MRKDVEERRRKEKTVSKRPSVAEGCLLPQLVQIYPWKENRKEG